MNILLVRHGEIDANVHKIYAGRSDDPLNTTGIQQAHEAGRALSERGLDIIFSSPVLRALQTAKIVCHYRKVETIIKSEFTEMGLGPWEGRSEVDIATEYPIDWKTWNNSPADLKLPGRELLADLQQRAMKGISDIERGYCGKKIVIITHVAVIRVILMYYRHQNLNDYKKIIVPNCSIFEVGP